MKKIILIVFLGVLTIPGISQIASAKLQASGLTCAMCAKAVYSKLESLPFIDKIDTDLNGSAFLIDFKQGVPVDIDAIKNKVEDAGFSVAMLDLNASFHEVAVKKDEHINYHGLVLHFMGGKEQTIHGDKTLRVIDKHYTTAKEQKKFNGLTDMECFKTGVAAACCAKNGKGASERIYHVMIN